MLFAGTTRADLRNHTTLAKTLEKFVVGCKIDVPGLWGIMGAAYTNESERRGQSMIREKAQEVMLEVVRIAAEKHPSAHFGTDAGQLTSADSVQMYWNTASRVRDDVYYSTEWCQRITRTKIYFGSCGVCGLYETQSFPAFDAFPDDRFITVKGRERMLLHNACIDKAACSHCTEKMGQYEETKYAAWLAHRLCNPCHKLVSDVVVFRRQEWIPSKGGSGSKRLRDIIKRWPV